MPAPKLQVVPETKFVPVRVTLTVCPCWAEGGEIVVRLGAAADGVMPKPLVRVAPWPSEFVTVIVRVPAEADAETEIAAVSSALELRAQ